MRKTTRVYLEASALWNLFYGEPGENLVEYCLGAGNLSCLTSVWSQLEIRRAIQKRLNQKEIDRKEAEDLLIFIDSYMQTAVARKILQEVEVTRDVLAKAKELIWELNLYASDALHLATAISEACKGILVDDHHFQRLRSKLETDRVISVWPTSLTVEAMLSGI